MNKSVVFIIILLVIVLSIIVSQYFHKRHHEYKMADFVLIHTILPNVQLKEKIM